MSRVATSNDQPIDNEAFLAMMRVNVGRSRRHIAAQVRIIEDLAAYGPSLYLETARDLMVTMRGHLSMEETILARLERQAASTPGTPRPATTTWTLPIPPS